MNKIEFALRIARNEWFRRALMGLCGAIAGWVFLGNLLRLLLGSALTAQMGLAGFFAWPVIAAQNSLNFSLAGALIGTLAGVLVVLCTLGNPDTTD